MINGMMMGKTGMTKIRVDLSSYAEENIPNYKTITQLPQETIDYLNSGLIVTDAGYAFAGCSNLTIFPALDIDTSECRTMDHMFSFCDSLTALDLSWLNTSSCTDMSAMFQSFDGHILDISMFDTAKCEDFSYMFRYSTIKTVNLSSFNTSKCKDMRAMFFDCSNLNVLDLNNFDTSACTDLSQMFCFCDVLTTIKGVIDMRSCTSCVDMFASSPRVRGVHLKNVPRTLSLARIGGTENVTYIIDNYID